MLLTRKQKDLLKRRKLLLGRWLICINISLSKSYVTSGWEKIRSRYSFPCLTWGLRWDELIILIYFGVAVTSAGKRWLFGILVCSSKAWWVSISIDMCVVFTIHGVWICEGTSWEPRSRWKQYAGHCPNEQFHKLYIQFKLQIYTPWPTAIYIYIYVYGIYSSPPQVLMPRTFDRFSSRAASSSGAGFVETSRFYWFDMIDMWCVIHSDSFAYVFWPPSPSRPL